MADDFPAYLQVADTLIARASKDRLADVAKILALNIGWYHERYGDAPQDELLRITRAETPNDAGKRLVLHGMQNLVGALAEVLGVTLDGKEESRH
jgi:hypothetical protein